MSTKNKISYPTGLFIPIEKQSIFMVAFEDMLISAYNLVPLFGPANSKNSCEVRLNYLGNKLYNPASYVSDLEKALEFLTANMSVLGPRNSSKRKRANIFNTHSQIINLEEESDEGTVDLVDADEGDSVIILEDSYTGIESQRMNTTTGMSTNCSIVDLSVIDEFPKNHRNTKASENEIQILNMKLCNPHTLPIQSSTPNSEIKTLESMSRKQGRKRKKNEAVRKNNNSGKPITRTISISSSGSLTSLTDYLSLKKRKLQDISNIHSTASCSTSPSVVQSTGLSENTLKYYKNISAVVGRARKEKRNSLTRKCFSGRKSLENDAKGKNKSPTRKFSPDKTCLERKSKKRKVFTPQNNARHKPCTHQRRLLQRSLNNKNSPRRVQSPREKKSNRISHRRVQNSVNKVVETNAFNPYPCEVDLEGLRPVIVDGCNVAIGHGKGKFSPKVATSPASAAGRWGDYRKCDSPKRTVDHMLQHISSTHPDIDYILWTGDLPPHDVWNQTRDENLMVLKQTVEQMTQLFPGIPIFPALGNHESAPVNSFPPPFIQNDYGIDWLYSALDQEWRKWLPSSVSRTVRRGAFYSVLVRPGFRIISLNMNYCNNKNWWLLLNSTDPAKELQWFIYELQSAEFNGEKVHVIGHIPPGHSDCLKVWSRNYYAIINRYESTITAQFFGHTHYDEYELFYDNKDLGRAINVAFIGPSVTPYYDLNPGYRIYYVDGDHDKSTRMVVDHETWIMNLKEANLYDYPIWYKLYSMRSAFQVPSLLPQELDTLVNRMAENETVFDQYYRYYWKNSPVRPPCDAECKKRLICDLRSGRSHDRRTLCQEIESRIDANTRTGWRAWLYNGIALSYVSGFSWQTWLLAWCTETLEHETPRSVNRLIY